MMEIKLRNLHWQLCFRCWNKGYKLVEDWSSYYHYDPVPNLIRKSCTCPKGKLREVRRLLTEAAR